MIEQRDVFNEVPTYVLSGSFPLLLANVSLDMSQYVLVDPSTLHYDVGPISTYKGAFFSQSPRTKWVDSSWVNESLIRDLSISKPAKMCSSIQIIPSTLLQ